MIALKIKIKYKDTYCKPMLLYKWCKAETTFLQSSIDNGETCMILSEEKLSHFLMYILFIMKKFNFFKFIKLSAQYFTIFSVGNVAQNARHSVVVLSYVHDSMYLNSRCTQLSVV